MRQKKKYDKEEERSIDSQVSWEYGYKNLCIFENGVIEQKIGVLGPINKPWKAANIVVIV